MAIHHFAVAAREHGNLEAELADAAAHAIHGGVVLARVAGVEDEPVDVPDLDFQGCGDLIMARYLGVFWMGVKYMSESAAPLRPFRMSKGQALCKPDYRTCILLRKML